MLAPIALYSDSPLSRILIASTYPLELVEASRWSKVHPELKGEATVKAVAGRGPGPEREIAGCISPGPRANGPET
ncbi:MAG: DUF3300 domain-containing protein [Burkholderiales bacterium]